LNLLAASLSLVGEYDRVLALYERLLGDYPKQPKLWLNYGHTLRTVRRGKDAAEAYRHCIALAPGLGDAYWSLANLKVAAFAPAEIALMRERLRRPDLVDEDRLHFNFALGKALEDGGEYADAFEHFQAGAAIRRTGLNYDPEANTTEMRRSQGLFTTGFFADRADAGCRSDAPIFIVGLPRSGSTLVEQILASHSAVEGTAELPELGLIAAGLARAGAAHEGYPEILASLGMRELAALGERYIELTRVYRKLGRPHFLDKMPNNFQHLGLIHLILPKARIVDVRRHPLGACFSAFKQHFAQGQAFSYDLTDLGRYYRDYVALIAHFEAVLPGRVHRVIYEDLVQDPEGEVRRLLQYCCLPFEPPCLKFYENDRAVRTVSSEQVRRPIFREGLERWWAYEPWLGPLKEALGPVLQHWRASTPPPG
jgi:tetratricopeptide (TPR) repeat protein